MFWRVRSLILQFWYIGSLGPGAVFDDWLSLEPCCFSYMDHSLMRAVRRLWFSRTVCYSSNLDHFLGVLFDEVGSLPDVAV